MGIATCVLVVKLGKNQLTYYTVNCFSYPIKFYQAFVQFLCGSFTINKKLH